MRKLIGLDGRPQWGRLLALPDIINWQDFDVRHPMGAKRSGLIKPFLFKHFDFYGVQGRDFTFGCGLVRLGLVNSAFIYFHSPKSGLVHKQLDLPLDLGLRPDYRPLGTTLWSNPLNHKQSITSSRQKDSRHLLFEWDDAFSGSLEM
ncbi:MAG: hypothetical protein R3194_07590, partial [Limnobacter sp.]|nr:hypothetical protein [Limnobacter sp.]